MDACLEDKLAVDVSLLEAGTPRSNSYRQCYPSLRLVALSFDNYSLYYHVIPTFMHTAIYYRQAITT
jgi:hypothetical protein